MDRFRILSGVLAIAAAFTFSGCRSHQFGHVIKDNQSDLVGSHSAGAETFNSLINESVARLLARQEIPYQTVNFDGGPALPKRVCFIGVENHSIEELGDFKEQIYEQIDSQILAAPHFEPVNRRYVQAGLFDARLRPDSLFMPQNMQTFSAAMQRAGQPFDYLMFAKLTSGTTESNHAYQRDYVLTLEVVDVLSGAYDKESAKIRKGYHKSRLGKWHQYNPFTRQ